MTKEKNNGRFKKGQSGNPAGRKQGSRNKTTLAIEKLLEGDAEAITRKAIALAKKGDMAALKLCMDRLCPPRKSRSVAIDIPEIQSASDVMSAFSSVLTALAAGEITIDETQAIAGVLEIKRRAIETVDLEQRIVALESVK